MSENKCNCGCSKRDEFIENLFQEYQPIKDNLIQMLNEVQEHYGYIPQNAQKELSEFLNIPIAVCLGTACYVKGSQKIMDRLKERLQIEPGETTKDGLFSIEETRCVGACGLAPVFTVNGEVYGKATVKKLDEVLDGILNNKEK